MSNPKDKKIKDLISIGDVEDITQFNPEDVGAHDVIWKDARFMKIVYYTVQGYNVETICKELNIEKDRLREIRMSDEFKLLRDYVTQEVVNIGRTFLMMSTVHAVKTILDLLDSDNDKVRLGAAKDVLDRVGLKSPDKIELMTKGDNLAGLDTEQLLNLIKMGQKEIYNVVAPDDSEREVANESECNEADQSSD